MVLPLLSLLSNYTLYLQSRYISLNTIARFILENIKKSKNSFGGEKPFK